MFSIYQIKHFDTKTNYVKQNWENMQIWKCGRFFSLLLFGLFDVYVLLEYDVFLYRLVTWILLQQSFDTFLPQLNLQQFVTLGP